MSPTEIAVAIAESSIGTALRESLILFPLIEGIHLLGLALSFGLILFTDLRLVGVFMPNVPMSQILGQLRRLVFFGFFLTFLSGFLLFWAEADTMIGNPAFLWKLGVIAVALLNAAVFETILHKRGAAWLDQVSAPAAARRAGWISLSFWGAATVGGRLIPYFA
jgi:hypothetical protein